MADLISLAIIVAVLTCTATIEIYRRHSDRQYCQKVKPEVRLP